MGFFIIIFAVLILQVLYCIACYYLDPLVSSLLADICFMDKLVLLLLVNYYGTSASWPCLSCLSMPKSILLFWSFGNERCKQRSPHLKKMDPFGAYFFISGDKIYSCCSWFFLTIVHSWNISKQTQVAGETKLIFYTCMTMWWSSVFHSQCKLIPLSFYCSSH